jgi:hypothetical protein
MMLCATASLALSFSTSCGGAKDDASATAGLQPGGSEAATVRPGLNSLTPQEKSEGWTLLWNGVDFDGWRGVGLDRVPEGHWLIEDGVIRKLAGGEVPRQADGQPVQGGDMMTAATFEDFDLRFEWKISPAGNSGLKYNVSEEMSKSFAPQHAAIGFEYQALDDTASYDPAILPNQTTGSLYDLVPAGAKTLKPVGEWNASEVIFRGNHGEHWFNGGKVLEFELGTPDMDARVAASKFKNIPDFAKKRPGHIVLQDHGSAVWFRNIKIRVIEP